MELETLAKFFESLLSDGTAQGGALRLVLIGVLILMGRRYIMANDKKHTEHSDNLKKVVEKMDEHNKQVGEKFDSQQKQIGDLGRSVAHITGHLKLPPNH